MVNLGSRAGDSSPAIARWARLCPSGVTDYARVKIEKVACRLVDKLDKRSFHYRSAYMPAVIQLLKLLAGA